MGMHPIVGPRLGCTTISDLIIDDVLLSEITETRVEEIIFRLKNSDALGVDGIRLSLLRHCLFHLLSGWLISLLKLRLFLWA
jgi:hypothetical protein